MDFSIPTLMKLEEEKHVNPKLQEKRRKRRGRQWQTKSKITERNQHERTNENRV
jgi:hypothetical protein